MSPDERFVNPDRVEILFPDGRFAVHSNMTRAELVNAMLNPDMPDDAFYWARMALRSIALGNGRLKKSE